MGEAKATLLRAQEAHLGGAKRMQGCRGGVVPFHDDGETLHMWVTKELVVTPAFSTLESNTDSCTSAELLGKVTKDLRRDLCAPGHTAHIYSYLPNVFRI